MASRKVKPVMENPELRKALKGFTPVFGSYQDRNIVARLGLLHQKLQGVDNEILRGTKQVAPRAITNRMKEILALERGLIAEITSRNMDF